MKTRKRTKRRFYGAKILVFLSTFAVLSFFSPFEVDGEIPYQWKDVYIGALVADNLAGVLLVPHPECAFSFRIRIKKQDESIEGIDHLFLISEIGPHSPDGQYARIKMDLGLPFGKKEGTPILKKPSKKQTTLVMEWSRQSEKTIIGRIFVPDKIEVELIHYFPFDFKGTYQALANGHIRGESSTPQKHYYLFWTSREGFPEEDSEEDTLILRFPGTGKKQVYFVASVGQDMRILRNQIYRYKNEAIIDKFLEEEENRYQRKRVKIEGLYEGAEAAITNNIFWTTLYQVGKHRLYTPAGRRWIFPTEKGHDLWTIHGWNSFFNALLISVESVKHAKDVLRSVLETQYPNGNIPHWRGKFAGTHDRSHPPVGSFVVWKCFQRDGDMDFLRYAYPFLKRWHGFWKTKKTNGQDRRDGNRDGLLEWGSDTGLIASWVPPWEENASGETRSSWESGQDDLPNWDRAVFSEATGTLTMNCVDLNSLYTLDAWCLAQMARILKKEKEFTGYIKEYEQMRDLVNEQLWNEADGFYYDRYWDGRFSSKKAASNFYPLLARIPDQERALLLKKRLLNEEEFWGDYVIPTVSRDNQEFADQDYWRGKIWAPVNYLIYQGLKAYGFDAVASEFANKSAELFMRSWVNFQICPENFDSRTGEAGELRYQSWGPLLGLIALEEYMDFTVWDGFRFGMIQPEKGGKLSRLYIQGRHYELEVAPKKIKLREEGRVILEASRAAVFRRFLYSEGEVAFDITTLKKNEIKINLLAKGRYQIEIDGQPAEIFEGKSTKFRIPEGEHDVLILLLEKKEE
jgi:hypothetical protein